MDTFSEHTVIDNMVYLLSCAVNGLTPDLDRVQGMNLTALYREADRHMLASAVAVALESAGVQDAAFVQARAKALRKTVIMDTDQARILARLEEAGIWYMPLKGAVLKDLYPVYGMRQMSDRDILFDASRAEEVRKIMTSLGYTTIEYGHKHHDEYTKPPVSNFELHRKLFEAMQGECVNNYYSDVESRLLKDVGNSFGLHFSPEDFYVHMTVHEFKHYAGDGTGLRSLLDTYVYLKNVNLDMACVAAETKKLGVADFERENRELAIHLFDGVPLSESEKRMLQRFIGAGVYGSAKIFAETQLAEKGRIGFFLSRLTLPYAVMQEEYPALRKMPVLYPLCWVHRLVYAFLFRHDRFMQQLKIGLKREDD